MKIEILALGGKYIFFIVVLIKKPISSAEMGFPLMSGPQPLSSAVNSQEQKIFKALIFLGL